MVEWQKGTLLFTGATASMRGGAGFSGLGAVFFLSLVSLPSNEPPFPKFLGWFSFYLYIIGELQENFFWEICIEGTVTESGSRIPTTRHPCGTCRWFHNQCQVIPPPHHWIPHRKYFPEVSGEAQFSSAPIVWGFFSQQLQQYVATNGDRWQVETLICVEWSCCTVGFATE